MEKTIAIEGGKSCAPIRPHQPSSDIPLPKYLEQTYWWAYVHPNSVRVFERQWLVNLILWGNFAMLRDAALAEMGSPIKGRVLQVACVYGDFSQHVARRLGPGAHLDVVDVAPVQLENLTGKVKDYPNVALHHQDSTALGFDDHSYDQTVVFFLLHEQPEDVRRKTIAEAIRVTRPGGKVIFVDYHGPRRSNPFRYVMKPVLTWLEPFAMDLWRQELPAFMPDSVRPEQLQSEFYFGGLYQKVVLTV